MNELIIKDNIGYCPKCNSKKITTCIQAVVHKQQDYNTDKVINPYNGTFKMSNKDKAREYDNATTDGVGCWYYECRKCGWNSELFTE